MKIIIRKGGGKKKKIKIKNTGQKNKRQKNEDGREARAWRNVGGRKAKGHAAGIRDLKRKGEEEGERCKETRKQREKKRWVRVGNEGRDK